MLMRKENPLKIAVIGPSGAGKTHLVRAISSYILNQDRPSIGDSEVANTEPIEPTVGAVYHTISTRHKDIQIWDVSGSQSMNFMFSKYVFWANVCAFVYDNSTQQGIDAALKMFKLFCELYDQDQCVTFVMVPHQANVGLKGNIKRESLLFCIPSKLQMKFTIIESPSVSSTAPQGAKGLYELLNDLSLSLKFAQTAQISKSCRNSFSFSQKRGKRLMKEPCGRPRFSSFDDVQTSRHGARFWKKKSTSIRAHSSTLFHHAMAPIDACKQKLKKSAKAKEMRPIDKIKNYWSKDKKSCLHGFKRHELNVLQERPVNRNKPHGLLSKKLVKIHMKPVSVISSLM